jgi:23S rRNA (guanosine2251-2'-O)-methyltransferase
VGEPLRRVYGLHAVESLLARRAKDIVSAALLEPGGGRTDRGRRDDSAHARSRGRDDGRRGAGRALDAIADRLGNLGVPLRRVPRAELDKLAGGGAHQGVVVEVRAAPEFSVNDLEALVLERGRRLRLLVLDQVEDPRNLGACLRTADAAGLDAVVVPKAHSAKLTAAAVKTATGAADTVPLAVVPNLARSLAWLKQAGVWVVGLDADAGQSLHASRLAPPIALVLGAEGTGLRRLTRESCDELVAIPMQGHVGSLNVSVAAGVVLFELLRQAPPS